MRNIMSCQINNLLKQAFRTFNCMQESFPQHLDKLRQLLDRTVPADIGFKRHELLEDEVWTQPEKAPVSYVEIFEDNSLSVGVFALKPGMKLPLHDHPHMYGLIKVIGGTVKVTSYSILHKNEDGTFEVEKHNSVILNDTDNCCMLEPQAQNLHEIESVNGAAAFLDILSPPYETFIPELGKFRMCHYFSPIDQVGINKYRLEKIRSPSWFWSDKYPYTGPEINVQAMEVEDMS